MSQSGDLGRILPLLEEHDAALDSHEAVLERHERLHRSHTARDTAMYQDFVTLRNRLQAQVDGIDEIIRRFFDGVYDSPPRGKRNGGG